MNLKNKGRRHKLHISGKVALSAIVMATILHLCGCSAGTRTTVDPASTDATHKTRIERPGRTNERTFELIIEPAPTTGVPKCSDHSTEPMSREPVDQLVALMTPISISAADQPVMQPRMQTVSWAPKSTRSQDVDPSIAEAIREATRSGNSVKLTVTETEQIPLTADEIDSTLSDKGAGLSTSSDEAAIGFDGNKNGSALPWGGKSGKTSWGLDASLFSKGLNPMHIIGAIVMLGCIVPIWSPPRRWAAAGVVAGVGLLIIAAGTVSEQAPWVFVLAILGFMGVAGWLGYEAWRSKRRAVALESVVQGVEKSNAESVKDNIKDAAGNKLRVVKAEINATKVKALSSS